LNGGRSLRQRLRASVLAQNRKKMMKADSNHIKINTKPNQRQISIYYEGLREYNLRFVRGDVAPFSAALENDKKEIIGGIKGMSRWGRFNIETLWVHDKYRKIGLGKKLIIIAENEAKRRKCSGIDLDTFSFQAPAFYERMGFKKIGKIGKYQNGFQRIFYSKEFKSS
jgi:ribosomal protein S18 acetylase RimI-like enzyme